MTEEEINVAKLRLKYAAWHNTKGDAAALYDLFADEITWGSLAGGREGVEFTLPRISKAEVVGYFEGLAKDWRMEFYRVDEYVAQGPRVVALGECSWTNRNTGKTVTIPKVDVWTFKNGKAVQFMEYYDTQKLLEASRP